MKPEEELELLIGVHYGMPKRYISEKLGIAGGNRYSADEERKRAVYDYLEVINPFFDIIFYRSMNLARGNAVPEEQEREYQTAMEEIQMREAEPLQRISMHFGADREGVAGIERRIQELKRDYRKERRIARQEA